MTPETKYFWMNGYRHTIGKTVRTVVTAFTLAPIWTAASERPSPVPVAPAMMLRRKTVTG
jgi:hypothetical protein